MMRVVLDTDVIVAAVRSPSGASKVLLERCLSRRLVLVISTPLLLEYEAVLSRPAHLLALGLDLGDLADILDAIELVGTRVVFDYVWRPLLPDPADEMVLETAINGAARLLITFNAGHFSPAAARFGIDVLRPGEALRRIG